jgi:hypothetical protein
MMKNIKTFSQLFENLTELKPEKYWSFLVYLGDGAFNDSGKMARFLVSGDSVKSITSEFIETLLPRYLGFNSIYELSPNIAPMDLNDISSFNNWVQSNIDEICKGSRVNTIYIDPRIIQKEQNHYGFHVFLQSFEGEFGDKRYTEISGNPDSIAWLITDYIKISPEDSRESRIIEVFDFLNSQVGYTMDGSNDTATIGEKYIDIVSAIFDSTESHFFYDYFKENPLELYIVHDKGIKEKILLKTGIKDFGKLGRGLKSGLI